MKETWSEHFERYLRDLDTRKPVVWGGDLNVAPTALGSRAVTLLFCKWRLIIRLADISNPKPNWNKSPGYTESETKAFARVVGDDLRGFVDVWRHLHPTLRHYTYFSYRFNCREKGIGWRLDMCTFSSLLRMPVMPSNTRLTRFSILVLADVLSRRLLSSVKTCEIRNEIYGASDHCPIIIELEVDL